MSGLALPLDCRVIAFGVTQNEQSRAWSRESHANVCLINQSKFWGKFLRQSILTSRSQTVDNRKANPERIVQQVAWRSVIR